MELHQIVGLIIAVLLMAVTILLAAHFVLKIKPLPIGRALIIAAVAVLLGRWFVAVLHLSAALSYALPTSAFFVLSYIFFKPKLKQFVLYWLVGFAAYLIIHTLASSIFDWPYMFPFWRVRLFGN